MDAKEPPEFLGRIVHAKRLELTVSRLRIPQSELEKSVQRRSAGIFRQSLLGRTGEQPECAIIAEIKKASPSRGVLSNDFRPAEIALNYRKAGARALSVLTDAPFFQGTLEDLKQAKAASSLPVLRKDFTLAEYHLYEAADAGADAVLLIAAILGPVDLRRLMVLAGELGLDALVEVHNHEELHAAADAGANLIGVNNRNLRTFEVTLETSLRLIDLIPDDAVAISESGLRTAEDLRRLRSAGFDAFLIGERFMTEKDPGAALERLLTEVAATAALG
jgi:indole-3-glycerol phosphate synthase